MSESLLFDTFPKGVGITRFTDGYELHKAASSTLRAKADTSLDPKFSAEQSTQRQALLDIAARLMVNERNKKLDEFCAEWIAFRKRTNGP